MIDAVKKISLGEVALLTREERSFLELEPANPADPAARPELRRQPLADVYRVFQGFLERLPLGHEYYEDDVYQVDQTAALINEFYQLATLYRDRGHGVSH